MQQLIIPAPESAPLRFNHYDPAHQWRESAPAAVQFVVGVDLGQARDFSAIVIDEVSLSERRKHHPGEPQSVYGAAQTMRRHRIRHVQRIPLGTSYPDVIAEVKARLLGLPAMPRQPALIVDATGCGRPVVDEMRRAGLHPVGATITYGSQWSHDERGFNIRVAKGLLASVIAVALDTERLTIAADGQHRETLRDELRAFRVKVTSSQNETFESWREADHDDLVLAAALAVWAGERVPPKMQVNPNFSVIGR